MRLRTRKMGRVVVPALLISCGAGIFAAATAVAAGAPSALPVGVIKARPQTITISDNLPGRLEPSKDAVVRARVTGIVEKRLFTEGAHVNEGDVLFTIDDRSYRATLASAKGSLARAIAREKANQADVKRYRRLVKAKAVSSQQYDQAEATLAVSNAEIEIARAAVEQAQIDCDYCTVKAPISGYIGKQDVTVGALVSSSSATPMAQIRQIDPLYVNVRQPAMKILKLKEMLARKEGGDEEKKGMELKVYLENGQLYRHPAEFLFTDVAVDASTGEGTLRASLPNPDGFLMPGLYVRVEVPQVTMKDVYLIPQQAIVRNERGNMLMVVTPDPEVPQQEGKPPLYKYHPKMVEIARSYGDNWVVTGGLEKGDTVVVDGMIKVNLFHVPHVIPVPREAAQSALKGPKAPAKGAAAPQQGKK